MAGESIVNVSSDDCAGPTINDTFVLVNLKEFNSVDATKTPSTYREIDFGE